MRRLRYAAVMPAVLGGLLAGMTPALAEPTLNSTNIPARYTNQVLDWHPCKPEELTPPLPGDVSGLECATYQTPRDWARPNDKPELTIAISRLKSTGPTTASVFTNPGGPGGAGRAFAAALRDQTRLREHQEIIGIDPRGTGKSTNVTCAGAAATGGHLDPRDRDPRNLNLIIDAIRYAANACRQASGDLGPLINTFQSIHDLDLLRALLGREKINWVGYSAGTWLGAHYAQRFPQRTGRFVLDSATEFTGTWQDSFDWQPMAFERRWRQDFLPWIARYEAKYHFGATAEAARATFEQLRQAISRNPVEIEGNRVYPAVLDMAIVGMLKKKASFPVLADTLVHLKQLAEGTAPAQQQERARTAVKAALAPDFLEATLFHTLCADSRWQGTPASAIRQSQQLLDRGYTLYGGGWLKFQLCRVWDTPARPLPKPDGKGVPPVLIVHAEHDGATAIEGARKARAHYQNSRLLTVTGEGDHGIYAMGNQAVDQIVDAYLVDGIVPPDRSVPGMPLPVPAS